MTCGSGLVCHRVREHETETQSGGGKETEYLYVRHSYVWENVEATAVRPTSLTRGHFGMWTKDGQRWFPLALNPPHSDVTEESRRPPPLQFDVC